MHEAALEGLVVVELATGVAPALAARMMAGYGADVIKVEEPAGDPLRGAGPFPPGRAGPETSSAFLYFHGGKSSVVLDLTTAASRSALADLIRSADVFLTDVPLAARQSLGIAEEDLAGTVPQLIVISVSPYGESGPHASYKATALTSAAAGGQMSLMGDAAREPLKAYGNQAEAQCSFSVFGAAMAAVLRRFRTGTGSYVELSIQELQASAMDIQGPMAYNHDPAYPGLGSRNGNGNLSTWSQYECKDGYAGIFVNPTNLKSLFQALGRPELVERMSDKAFIRGELRTLISEWCAARTCAEVYGAAVAYGAPFSYVATPEDLLTSEAIEQTGIWIDVEHPIAGKFRVPGPPFRSESRYALERAPLLGEHTADVLDRLAGRDVAEIALIVGQASEGRTSITS